MCASSRSDRTAESTSAWGVLWRPEMSFELQTRVETERLCALARPLEEEPRAWLTHELKGNRPGI